MTLGFHMEILYFTGPSCYLPHFQAYSGMGVSPSSVDSSDPMKSQDLVDKLRANRKLAEFVCPIVSRIHPGFEGFQWTSSGEFDQQIIPGYLLYTMTLFYEIWSPKKKKLKMLAVSLVEGGLHPTEQIRLMREIRDVDQDRLLMVTTNSPFTMHEAEYSRVLCYYGVDLAQNLSNHPDLPKWKDVMCVHEFWTMVDPNWPMIPNTGDPAVSG